MTVNQGSKDIENQSSSQLWYLHI